LKGGNASLHFLLVQHKMIKFFRKIRQNLLLEGKIGKYLKYAVGEILLVTIGILIALKVNDMNEQSKLHAKEIVILKDIQHDLEANIKDMEKGIGFLKDWKVLDERIMKSFETSQPFNKEMNGWYGQFNNMWNPKFSTGSYDNLTVTGLNIISSNTIRDQIIEIFDVELPWIEKDLTKRMWNYNENVVLPMITKYLYCEGHEYWELSPSNYELMMSDQSFYNMCSILKMYYGRDINHCNNCLSLMKQLNSNLEKEIKRLSEN
jgi:hypothetical protein